MKFSLVLFSIAFLSSFAIADSSCVGDEEILDIDFDLKNFRPVQDPKAVIQNDDFWARFADDDAPDTIYLIPENASKFKPEEKGKIERPAFAETLGMTSDQALKHSRDLTSVSTCGSGLHNQGDMANRWCHSTMSRMFSSTLEAYGVNSTIASLAGGIFWVPKEYFYDLNPSSGDMVVTYSDKLGTKRTTFEITVFGDAFFKKRMGEGFHPFKESTPFISIKRVLGPKR